MVQLKRGDALNASGLLNRLRLFKRGNFASAAAEKSLNGKAPLRLLGTPEDPWHGNAAAGQDILDQRFSVYGQFLDHPNQENNQWNVNDLWTSKDINDRWLEHLHSFSWLRDLNAIEDKEKARLRAQELTSSWMEHHGKWQEFSWRPDITGRRIMNWTAYAPLILDSDDLFYRGNILRMLGRQTRHLMRSVAYYPAGSDKILAIAGLVQAGLFLPNEESWLSQGLELLNQELPNEILKDGGIKSRSPADQHRLLRDLLMLRSSFAVLKHSVPEILQSTIARMIPFMLCLTHGDGKLALFNGAYEQDEHDILSTYKMAKLNVPMMMVAEETGFCRIESGRTVIIMDAGPPAPVDISSKSHAGTLSFEMSRGRSRIIVNCGSATYLPCPEEFSNRNSADDEALRTEQDYLDLYWMCRSTAAHSTAILNDKNSSEIRADGFIGASPTVVESLKIAENGHHLIEASHDGFMKKYNIIHERKIYVNETGEDIRGADVFSSEISQKKAQKFDVRFHLHPDVKANYNEDRTEVVLKTADGERWVFQCADAALKISSSLYLGGTGAFQTTSQIVLSGLTDDLKREVQWSFKLQREDPVQSKVESQEAEKLQEEKSQNSPLED